MTDNATSLAVTKLLPTLIKDKKLMLISPERAIELESWGYLRVADEKGNEYLVNVWPHKTELDVFHIHEILEVVT